MRFQSVHMEKLCRSSLSVNDIILLHFSLFHIFPHMCYKHLCVTYLCRYVLHTFIFKTIWQLIHKAFEVAVFIYRKTTASTPIVLKAYTNNSSVCGFFSVKLLLIMKQKKLVKESFADFLDAEFKSEILKKVVFKTPTLKSMTKYLPTCRWVKKGKLLFKYHNPRQVSFSFIILIMERFWQWKLKLVQHECQFFFNYP